MPSKPRPATRGVEFGSALARLGGLEPPPYGLEARQLFPCFPSVVGPGVRSRVRMASRDQRHRQRLSPSPRGRVPEGRRGRIIGRGRQPPRGRRQRAVVPMLAASHARGLPAPAPCGLRDTSCAASPHALDHAWEIEDRANTPSAAPSEFGATETRESREPVAGSNRGPALNCGSDPS
jgi:hypothetical protein